MIDPSPPSSAEVKNYSTVSKGLRDLWKGETYLHEAVISYKQHNNARFSVNDRHDAQFFAMYLF
jgi:hypothetical protein